MRLLFVSNLYPPAHLGGMELRLQETVDGLERRGHSCQVLTGDFVPPDVELPDEVGVDRVLSLESDVYRYRPLHYLLNRRSQLQRNREVFIRLASTFKPDLVFFWCMWNLSPAIIVTANEFFPNRVVQSFAGYWPVEPDAHEEYWLADAGGNWMRRLRRLVAILALSRWYRPIQWSDVTFQHAIFVSRYVQSHLRQAGLVFPHGKVVLSGIDVEEFAPSSAAPFVRPKLRAIYAGGWSHHKGGQTAIEAMHVLNSRGVDTISLTMIGRGHPDERARLEMMVRDTHLQGHVFFEEAVVRSEMPGVLRNHDVLVVPTLSPDPLPRIVMEGMASSLAVIASRTGGTPEMVDEGCDGFLFAPGDSNQLAELLVRLVNAPELRRQVAAKARATAVARFDIRRMIDDIEEFLEEVQIHAQREGAA